jgi:cation/acetate symporter
MSAQAHSASDLEVPVGGDRGSAAHRVGSAAGGLAETLTTQPAAWTVPLAFTVMVAVSVTTRRRTPADVGAPMLRLHAAETLRL